VPAVKEMTLEKTLALTVPAVQPMDWDTFGTLATMTPMGRLSVKETLVAATVLELVIVNVRRDVEPTGIVDGEKALEKLTAV